jgi:hypothetical protein
MGDSFAVIMISHSYSVFQSLPMADPFLGLTLSENSEKQPEMPVEQMRVERTGERIGWIIKCYINRVLLSGKGVYKNRCIYENTAKTLKTEMVVQALSSYTSAFG